MKKESVIDTGALSSKNLRQMFKCGECLHHKCKPHRDKEDLCVNQGIRGTALAPKCFTPNVTEIAQDEDQMVQLAYLWETLTYKQRRILLGMLMSKPKGRKLKLGTKVFFHAFGKEFLSNYLAGYVMGYASNGELIISGSPDKNARGQTYLAYVKDTSVMTAKEFKPVKSRLLEQQKITDPSQPLVKIKKVEIDYEPPTMESAPDHWHASAEKRRKMSVTKIKGGKIKNSGKGKKPEVIEIL